MPFQDPEVLLEGHCKRHGVGQQAVGLLFPSVINHTTEAAPSLSVPFVQPQGLRGFMPNLAGSAPRRMAFFSLVSASLWLPAHLGRIIVRPGGLQNLSPSHIHGNVEDIHGHVEDIQEDLERRI